MSALRPILVSALLVLLSGCGPRLTVGTTTGSWHQDLPELVHGNRRTEAEARVYQAYLWCGYGGTIAGGGFTWVGALATLPGYPSKTTNIAGAVLLGEGLGTLVTAAVCFSQARVHAMGAGFTKGEKGAGLGLPSARVIVRELGGELKLESTPGLSTTARVFLPAAPPAIGGGDR
jgi:hypothetical protein